jgi:chemotaxis protein methyltransferase CheR
MSALESHVDRALPGADDYVAFCEGVRRLTAIDLLQYKRGQMERRIRSFAGRRGTPELSAYLRLLHAERGELDAFLDRVTINVSQLWRNPEQWTLLARAILPELAERGRVRAWSAGCSYGAEAYTLATVTRELVPSLRVEVKGTDIDRRMVERARTGWFSEEDARTAPPALLARWFDRSDRGWRARSEIAARCSFEVGDLLRGRFGAASHDLILCRNTVIYFTEEIRDRLHERLAEALRPGGYLMVGSTERVAGAAEIGLEPAHPFIYRKR